MNMSTGKYREVQDSIQRGMDTLARSVRCRCSGGGACSIGQCAAYEQGRQLTHRLMVLVLVVGFGEQVARGVDAGALFIVAFDHDRRRDVGVGMPVRNAGFSILRVRCKTRLAMLS
jgi:hypothetical protein